MHLSLENGSLLVCLASAYYLKYLCTTSPNPPPTTPYENDLLGKAYLTWRWPRELLMEFISCYHLALIVFSEQRASFCPHPELLNKDIFSWSWLSIAFVSIIFIAAPFRLLAYAQLGKNFTFRLAKPSHLVTTGLYRYVQHPSYTALFPVSFAVAFFTIRLDGPGGCFLPWRIDKVQAWNFIFATIWTAMWFLYFGTRVRQEEKMLRKEFGKDWEEYHRTTRRFIPGII